MEEKHLRTTVLLEALPYIRKFYGQTMVIKCGGKLLDNERLKENFAQDIVLLKFVGIKPVVIHGGGPQVTQLMERLGKKVEFEGGLRKTDKETLDIAEMVLGKINKDLVNLLHRLGGKAVGLSGKDGHMIKAKKIPGELGLVGEIEKVDTGLLEILEKEGFIPVISPLGVDEDGQTLNINADEVAGKIAASIKALKLIYLTDIPGIFADPSNPSTLISTLNSQDAEKLLEEGKIKGGMIPKVKASLRALKEGVEKVHIINGLLPHSLLLEIFTDKGIGTEIVH